LCRIVRVKAGQSKAQHNLDWVVAACYLTLRRKNRRNGNGMS